MAQIIPTFHDRRDYTVSVVLDEQTYRLRLVWRSRLGAWYMDARNVTLGVDVIHGRRVSPGAVLLGGARMGQPPGALVADGLDPYRRSDLGRSLRLVYVTQAEVAAIVPNAPPLLRVL